MNKEEAIKNLKQYIEEDFAYREPIKNMSDFDRYCYNHCKDIETVLSELKNSIPKQVILDKIDELDKNELLGKMNFEQVKFTIDILQEILVKGEIK